MKNENITFEEMTKRKDFICSTNVERALYELLINCGVKESDVVAEGKYDKQASLAKERIYSEFSKALGFKYHWDSWYRLDDSKM